MKTLKNFLFYNNTIPIVFGILFLSTSLTFAANEEARELIVSSESRLSSVDNTYLIQNPIDPTAFDTYVLSITEDDTFYYVEYAIETISIIDGIWLPTTRTDSFSVQKSSIEGQDLGIFVSKELADVRQAEIRLLTETREVELSLGQRRKEVTTEYSGLIGRVLDPELEVFPGYEQVVINPPAEEAPSTPPVFEAALADGRPVVVQNQIMSNDIGDATNSTSETGESESPEAPERVATSRGTSTADSDTATTSPAVQQSSTTQTMDQASTTLDEGDTAVGTSSPENSTIATSTTAQNNEPDSSAVEDINTVKNSETEADTGTEHNEASTESDQESVEPDDVTGAESESTPAVPETADESADTQPAPADAPVDNTATDVTTEV